MGSIPSLYDNSSSADSSANDPVASPGPRIGAGTPTFNGTTLYRVFTFGLAYRKRDTPTALSVNSSYTAVCECDSCVIPTNFPSVDAPRPIFCIVKGR